MPTMEMLLQMLEVKAFIVLDHPIHPKDYSAVHTLTSYPSARPL